MHFASVPLLLLNVFLHSAFYRHPMDSWDGKENMIPKTATFAAARSEVYVHSVAASNTKLEDKKISCCLISFPGWNRLNHACDTDRKKLKMLHFFHKSIGEIAITSVGGDSKNNKGLKEAEQTDKEVSLCSSSAGEPLELRKRLIIGWKPTS